MTDVTVRSATPDDAAVLAAVYRAAYRENRELGFPARAESATSPAVADWRRSDRVLVADREGTAVGGVRLSAVDGDDARAATAKLSRLAVRPDLQGEGVGSRLVAAAERRAREAGHSRMRLTTPPEHPTLPDFYRRRGYEVVDDYPLAYRDYDEVVMEKRLE